MHPCFGLFILFYSTILIPTLASTGSLAFRSGGDLAPLRQVTIPTGFLHTTGTADERGRVTFNTISLEDFWNIRIFKACLDNGRCLAVRPAQLRLAPASPKDNPEFVITEGAAWQDRDIMPSQRYRFFRSRRARL